MLELTPVASGGFPKKYKDPKYGSLSMYMTFMEEGVEVGVDWSEHPCEDQLGMERSAAVSHPEGVFEDLSPKDDQVWHLGVYLKCLESWDFMNAAIRASRDELAERQTTKHVLRYQGLSLLREVDNRDHTK